VTGRLGLRARLTIFVTLVFAAALAITSIVVVAAVENRLVADSRANAETVLGDYLDTIYGGIATVGVVDPDDTTRFFYLDEQGTEINEQAYFETIFASFDAQLADAIDPDDIAQTGPGGVIVGSTITSGPIRPFATPGIVIDAQSGVLSSSDGGSITLIEGPVPTGDPHRIDRGPDVVAVAQTLTFADGATIDVGVSNPLKLVTDSLDTITAMLWLALPTLIAATALITWLAATRALRPVKAIADQADAITATNIDQRVPLHDANDEIRHLGVTVNNMLDRLQHAQDRQHQLVADASHELRSPVAASRAQLEVATTNPKTVDWPATAHKVLAEQEHLGTLIDDLLALSGLDETGAGTTTDVDLDDLVAAEARRQPVTVDVTIAQPVRVSVNQQLITRAIRNLLDNAARHADHTVAIALTNDKDHAVIDVDDDGPGIPPDQRDHVFDRFTRLDEARDRDRGGSGLGLAIARQVARAHDGDIVCTNSPHGGARLTLTLPSSPIRD
jgi:signal transduction histidine kinase